MSGAEVSSFCCDYTSSFISFCTPAPCCNSFSQGSEVFMRKVIVDSLSVVYKYTCVQTVMGWVEIMLFLVLSLLDLEPKKE